MTDIEIDLMMANAEVLSLKKTVREQADTIANQRTHIAALQNMIEQQRKQIEASVPVKRGRWLPQVLLGQRVWDCSECKTLGSPHWKCCPVCEARMDGVLDG